MVGLRSTGLPECGPTESSAPEPCYLCINLVCESNTFRNSCAFKYSISHSQCLYFSYYMLRSIWDNSLIIFNFLFIDECSSPPSYFDDDFQDVDIKEEPLECSDVSYSVIFFSVFFLFIYFWNIITEVNLNIARSSQFSG